jgi:uncharacterized protein
VRAEFVTLLKHYGFPSAEEDEYPTTGRACSAQQTQSFVVDCDGDMYKCWNVVGQKQRSVGTLFEFTAKTRQQAMEEARWMTWEPFAYEKCRNCRGLPLCMGDCPYHTLYGGRDELECFQFTSILEERVRRRIAAAKEVR